MGCSWLILLLDSSLAACMFRHCLRIRPESIGFLAVVASAFLHARGAMASMIFGRRGRRPALLVFPGTVRRFAPRGAVFPLPRLDDPALRMSVECRRAHALDFGPPVGYRPRGGIRTEYSMTHAPLGWPSKKRWAAVSLVLSSYARPSRKTVARQRLHRFRTRWRRFSPTVLRRPRECSWAGRP